MSTDLAARVMTEADASKLTERIRITAHNYSDARQKLQELVSEAKAGNAHLALGYASWTAYLADVLGEEPMRLASEVRPEMATLLSGEGMPAGVIANVLGVSDKTVRRDLKGGQMSTFEPRQVTKTDGKGYTVTPPAEPTAPRRTPLADTARDVGYDLRKTTERLERLLADDRLTTNRDTVGAHLRHHIKKAIEVCQDFDRRINN